MPRATLARAQHVANDVEPGRQQLIPLAQHEIAGATVQTVDARALHAFLEVGKVFAAWVQERIQQYGFTEGQDYVVTVSKTGIRSNVIQKDYHLTLDTAKELAMVERNAKGREARRYFIECEKRLKEREAAGGRQVAALPDFSNPAAAARVEHLAAALAAQKGKQPREGLLPETTSNGEGSEPSRFARHQRGLDLLANRRAVSRSAGPAACAVPWISGRLAVRRSVRPRKRARNSTQDVTRSHTESRAAHKGPTS
ncbi:hypothetical protein G7087_03755 [Rubrivivax benzoatilyticus]|uniref:AntA/AntB antirepressor domain-containing protein n=2 Tax=Rubrivivax benzoatilyticus TaxID=316997 RepID=A0ABX0HT69_9BURK|nr:anti-repressor protein [Rubrivivax benzoatilyticus JA2 = ATCC BAA-35]NHK97480.1 hypothetical protein [Rubrivivax benzoatilyticus]NHL22825.1 hypothetical protein [Rubrivivax benzoatilyticus]